MGYELLLSLSVLPENAGNGNGNDNKYLLDVIVQSLSSVVPEILRFLVETEVPPIGFQPQVGYVMLYICFPWYIMKLKKYTAIYLSIFFSISFKNMTSIEKLIFDHYLNEMTEIGPNLTQFTDSSSSSRNSLAAYSNHQKLNSISSLSTLIENIVKFSFPGFIPIFFTQNPG